jgi:hypothetical protein
MLPKKSLSVLAALIFLCFLGVPPANAAPQCFTLESLEGSYASIGHYGANVAIGIGTRQFDGAGNLTGTVLVNEPTPGSTTGGRTVVTATQMGTYTVNCDGTGVFTRIVTVNGVKTSQTDNFVITKAIVKNHHLLATAIVDAQTTPSAIVAGGIFLTRSFTRLPDGEDQDD